MQIANFFENTRRFGEDIDRTLQGVLVRKEKKKAKPIKHKNIEVFGIDSRTISIPLNDFLMQTTAPQVSVNELGNSPWYENSYQKFKDELYYRRIGIECVCCGRISLKKEYCEKCEYRDFMHEFHKLIEKEDFQEAMQFYKERIDYYL